MIPAVALQQWCYEITYKKLFPVTVSFSYLFKCVILLIFRAARHGLNMDGKLARLRKQDEQLLAVIKKTEEANSLTNKNK